MLTKLTNDYIQFTPCDATFWKSNTFTIDEGNISILLANCQESITRKLFRVTNQDRWKHINK